MWIYLYLYLIPLWGFVSWPLNSGILPYSPNASIDFVCRDGGGGWFAIFHFQKILWNQKSGLQFFIFGNFYEIKRLVCHFSFSDILWNQKAGLPFFILRKKFEIKRPVCHFSFYENFMKSKDSLNWFIHLQNQACVQNKQFLRHILINRLTFSTFSFMRKKVKGKSN